MSDFWKEMWRHGARLGISNHHGLIRCAPEWSWESSHFKDYDIWMVLKGTGQMTLNGKSYDLNPGFSICFRPGNIELSVQHDPDNPLHVFFCHFDLIIPLALKKQLSSGLSPGYVQPDNFTWSSVRRFMEGWEIDKSEELNEAILWQFLLRRDSTRDKAASHPEDRIRKQIGEIRENPAAAWSVEEMAQNAGISSGHFRRIFQSLTGKQPIGYVIDSRIQRACLHLRQTKMQIQDVATTSGYRDVYFFSRQFKQKMGITPSEYRHGS